MPEWLIVVLLVFGVTAVGLWLLGQLTGAVNAVDHGVRWLIRRMQRDRKA